MITNFWTVLVNKYTPLSCVSTSYFHKKDIDTWYSSNIDFTLHPEINYIGLLKTYLFKKKKTSFDYLRFHEVFNTVSFRWRKFYLFFFLNTDERCIKHTEQGFSTVNNSIKLFI